LPGAGNRDDSALSQLEFQSALRQHKDLDTGRLILLTQNLLGSLLEVRGFGVGNVGEGLWIAIREREPRALHLDHDAMAAAECVEEVGHREV